MNISFAFIILFILEQIYSASLDIQVLYPLSVLPPNPEMYIRGDSLGLNWNSGSKLTHSSTNDNQWDISLSLDADSVSSFPLKFQFKILVNDQFWQQGHNEMLLISNNDNDAEFSCYPYFISNQGSVHIHSNIYSKFFDNYRSMRNYLPPSYFENTLKPIPHVLVMHDAQNLYNDSNSAFGIAWHVQDTLDILISSGVLEEVAIIGVDNGLGDRTNEMTYSSDPSECGPGKTFPVCGHAKEYIDFISSTILPLAKTNYPRLFTGKQTMGIGGSSLGGLVSCWAGFTRPQDWDHTICMSSSFWWNNQDFNTTILTQNPVPPTNNVFYLDSGNAGPGKDDLVETITVKKHLENLGLNPFYYMQNGGQHNEYFWGKRFHVPMEDFYTATFHKL